MKTQIRIALGVLSKYMYHEGLTSKKAWNHHSYIPVATLVSKVGLRVKTRRVFFLFLYTIQSSTRQNSQESISLAKRNPDNALTFGCNCNFL